MGGLSLRNIAAIAVICLLGCKERPPRTEKDALQKTPYLQEPIHLAPFHIRAVSKGMEPKEKADIKVDIYDAAELFRRASVEYRKENFDESEKQYRRAADEFPLSDFASAALYNAGLAQERLGKYGRAAETYTRLTVQYPKSKDVTDALFRLLGCMEALEAWDDAVRIADKIIIERSDITAPERVECLARKGAALLESGKYENSRQVLREAVYRSKSQKENISEAATYFVAMARFKLGEILEKEMHEKDIPSKEELLKSALEKKCSLLLEAQAEYTESIRLGHAQWAAAAAYRIGHLYRVLWEDLSAAPPPPDLDQEKKEIYLQVLKERIQVLLKKAMCQWERVLKMAKRLEFSNEWITKTKKDMQETRALIITEDENDTNTSILEKKEEEMCTH